MLALARLALLVQTLIAAGTFLVAKDASLRFGSLPLVWFRITLSAVLMGAAYTLYAKKLPPFSKSEWFRVALLGVLGTTLNQGLFIYGIRQTEPLHGALIYAFTPVVVLAGSMIWLGERLHALKFFGVILAIGGVILVLTAQGLNLAEGPLRGDLFIFGAVIAWSAFTLLGKRIIQKYGVFPVLSWAFVFGALSVLPAAPFLLKDFDWQTPGLTGWLELSYLSAITSGIAFTLWYWALKTLEASEVAVFTNLQAPMTALLSWLIFSQVPSLQVVGGGLLVILGVTLTQIRKIARADQFPKRA